MSASPDTLGNGLLLVGHGTRDARGAEETLAVARQVAVRLEDVDVEACFLELAEPTIPAAIDRLVERGVRRLTVLPLLLFAAGHAKRDIPQATAAAAARHGLELRQAMHLGCHDRLVELSALRYRQAIEGRSGVSDDQTLLLMVGRGSQDPEANSEMARFTRLRWERAPVGWAETCYTALTQPSLEQALDVVARMGFGRIVVQPHLLFHGELAGRVRQQVAEFSAGHPEQEWLVTELLGPHELLVDALIDRANAS